MLEYRQVTTQLDTGNCIGQCMLEYRIVTTVEKNHDF